MEVLLQQITSIAMQAGEAILDVASALGEIDVLTKADHSPVTEADMVANEVICKQLATVSEYPIISEETVSDESIVKAQASDRYWLVDPLDGTKEFIAGRKEYTVNIALIDHQKPILGVVYAPALGHLYYAAQGVGAFKLDPDKNILTDLGALAHQKESGGMLQVVASKSHLSEETRAFVDHCAEQCGAKKVEFVQAGSSLKFCLVAERKADFYPRLGPTMLWDTAAAQCVLEQTGGAVLDFTTRKSLVYDLEQMRNPWFIACQDSWLEFFYK